MPMWYAILTAFGCIISYLSWVFTLLNHTTEGNAKALNRGESNRFPRFFFFFAWWVFNQRATERYMKKLFSFIFVTMITGQAWTSVIPSVLFFPSQGDKVKNKVIEYPKNGYVANVMLQNKQIAIWEHISINDISDGKRILEGMVCGVDLYKDSYDLRVS